MRRTGAPRSWRQGRQGWEDGPCGSARERATSPPPAAEQSLQVLPGRNQRGLTIDLLQPTQAETAQPVPVLGFGKEGLHPDLALAHRFGVRLRGVIAAHPIQVRLVAM